MFVITLLSVTACERDLVFNSSRKSSSDVAWNGGSEEGIAIELFTLLDLQKSGLAEVKQYVDQKQWGMAAQ